MKKVKKNTKNDAKKQQRCLHSSIRYELEWVTYVKICNICDKTLGLNDVKCP